MGRAVFWPGKSSLLQAEGLLLTLFNTLFFVQGAT